MIPMQKLAWCFSLRGGRDVVRVALVAGMFLLMFGPSAALAASSMPLTVLWDTAHTGALPTAADYTVMRADLANLTITDKSSGDVVDAELEGVDVYVLVEPDDHDLSASETLVVRRFLDSGGRWLFLSDYGSESAGVNAVLADFGIQQTGNFSVGIDITSDVTSHPLTDGVAQYSYWVNGTRFSVTTPAVSCIRHTSETVVAASEVGTAKVVVLGDETSLQNVNYGYADNAVLARNIFDWFRRPATPGTVAFDTSVYPSSGSARVEVWDPDLRGTSATSVSLFSDLGDTETLVLAPDTGDRFSEIIALRTAPLAAGDGILAVRDASVITAVYQDADDGSGAPADMATSAIVDGRAPNIANVVIDRVGPFSARVRWTTDEPATARAVFGPAPGPPSQSTEQSAYLSSHSLDLYWLTPEREFVLMLESTDPYGNRTVDDAGGLFHRFTTCRTRRTTGPIDVLLLSSELTGAQSLDIASKLLSDPRIARVADYNWLAGSDPTTLLREFDVVLIHVDQPSPYREEIGNLLADHVDRGGPIVSLCRSTINPASVAGRFRDAGYGVFVASNSASTNQPATLGMIYEPESVLMDGVTAFDGGAYSLHQTNVELTSGALRLADWSDGEPLVASRVVGGTRLVGLNFYGPSSLYNPALWDVQTDGSRMIANALVWASRALECDAWATPTLVVEPGYSPGTSNTIYWQDFPQAEDVRVEWSLDGFTSVTGATDWLPESLHECRIAGLGDGQVVSYRMQGRSVAEGYSPISNVVASVQDASPPATSILALPTTTTTYYVELQIDGGDALSGLATAELFWRKDGVGDFQSIATFTSLPQTYKFAPIDHGGPGFYEFLIVGVDQVDNRETKTGPDAVTRVVESQSRARTWPHYDLPD